MVEDIDVYTNPGIEKNQVHGVSSTFMNLFVLVILFEARKPGHFRSGIHVAYCIVMQNAI